MEKKFTGLLKKSGSHYVALCLELNVASQGESIEEAKRMLQDTCAEYLCYLKEEHLEKETRPVPLEILREFLSEDVKYFHPSDEIYGITPKNYPDCEDF